MKLFKKHINAILFVLIIGVNTSQGQTYNHTKHQRIAVENYTTIKLDTKYTNIQFEATEENVVIIDAIMSVKGLSKKEADNYFKKWFINTSKKGNTLNIYSSLNSQANNINRNGFYNGYFIKETKMDEIKSDIENIKRIYSTKDNTVFDFDLYIKDGDSYLYKWQKENNEPIGKRWFNKTKEERIQLQKSRKPKKQKKAIKPKEELKSKHRKVAKPISNIRALSSRAIINKTLKIKVPKTVYLNIKARHGKITFSHEVKDLVADLNNVLLTAKMISGSKTKIKGFYMNLEVDEWNSGDLDVKFSEYILIKKAKNINILSEASVVSIDKITNSLNAKGNFKMLSVDLTSSVTNAKISVEDSKQVWIKLPTTKYNLSYTGTNTKLIHPKKFNLMSSKNNQSKQFLKVSPLKNFEKIIEINAVSSIMQIYDVPWENLKIKSLYKL